MALMAPYVVMVTVTTVLLLQGGEGTACGHLSRARALCCEVGKSAIMALVARAFCFQGGEGATDVDEEEVC